MVGDRARAQRGLVGLVGAIGLAAALGALVTATSGCRGRNLASHLAPSTDLAPATGLARCGVIRSHDRPLIIEWPSADRGTLETQVHRGDHLIVVRYEGCDMEILRRCRARGRYGYAAVQRKEEHSSIRSTDDLYAKIPIGAARLEAELERSGALTLEMTVVGAYEADALKLGDGDLEGSCDGATHVVTGVTVGAFALSSASGAGVRAGVEVGAPGAGIGGGLRSTSDRGFRRSDGDLGSCWESDAAAPPEQCGALLRIEVEPLGGATVAEAPRRRGRARACPKGAAQVPEGILPDNGRLYGGNKSVPGFCIDTHEVTMADYGRCVRDGACSSAPTSVSWEGIADEERREQSALCNGDRNGHRRHPVNCVSWHQAESYCQAVGGRLPTEEEWEWAARGGEQHRSYPWGEDDPDAHLVNACGRECSKQEGLYSRRDGHQGTAPVGSYRAGRGRWYLEDLAGNVWEWTQSGDHEDRVIRGGGFASNDDQDVRIGGREMIHLRDRRADVGFRCVYEAAPEPPTP
ncbi:MAG: formylglycine-generating enzyme family protein [Nannocystaceae bacterium]